MNIHTYIHIYTYIYIYIYIYYLSSFNGRILTYEGFAGTSDGKESTYNATKLH